MDSRRRNTSPTFLKINFLFRSFRLHIYLLMKCGNTTLKIRLLFSCFYNIRPNQLCQQNGIICEPLSSRTPLSRKLLVELQCSTSPLSFKFRQNSQISSPPLGWVSLTWKNQLHMYNLQNSGMNYQFHSTYMILPCANANVQEFYLWISILIFPGKLFSYVKSKMLWPYGFCQADLSLTEVRRGAGSSV